MKTIDLRNDTGKDLMIYAVILRVWDDTTFEQILAWPVNTSISQVLRNYQHCCLGDTKVYKIIDYYIPRNDK